MLTEAPTREKTESKPARRNLDKVEISGVPFPKFTETECVDYVMEEFEAGRGGWIVTPNLEILRLLTYSREVKETVRGCDLFVADGMPIVWLSRILGDPLPERVAGSSLISTLSGAAAERGLSIYLLGGEPGTAEGAAEVLCRRFPGLRIAGTSCPKLGFEQSKVGVNRILSGVLASRPDIVYVALGCPKQERVIRRLRPDLPGTWFMGVGISFSYLSGDVRRAPAFFRRTGLEWAYRMAQEPGRLVRRYLGHDLPFALRLLGLALRSRFGLRAEARRAAS